jgi:transporter family protein
MVHPMTWWMFAFVSALAASATAILAKTGITGVPSNLATAVRTGVVLVFAWGITFTTGDHRGLRAAVT